MRSLQQLGISLKNIMNKIGPRTLAWGTPEEVSLVEDRLFPIFTN